MREAKLLEESQNDEDDDDDDEVMSPKSNLDFEMKLRNVAGISRL